MLGLVLKYLRQLKVTEVMLAATTPETLVPFRVLVKWRQTQLAPHLLENPGRLIAANTPATVWDATAATQ